MGPSPDLAARLDDLVRRYDRSWLDSDPLRWPRRYRGNRDRELAAVVAALLAYGRVASIHRSVASVLAALGPRPGDALAPSRRGRLAARLGGLRHRFTDGADLAWVLSSVARAWDQAGSLGAYVEAHAEGPEPLRAGLSAWHHLAASAAAPSEPRRARARAFLLPDPARGAACKRSLLLCRWCVRPDDGLDLGLWGASGRLAPRDLLLPLDTHVHQVALQVGLTARRTADWEAVREVTAALRAFAPDDPVRYDFALARPGIVGRCRHRHVPDVCAACDLRTVCRFGAAGRRVPRVTRPRRTSGSPRTTPSPAPTSRTSAP